MSLNPVTELIQPLPKVIANPVIDSNMPPYPVESGILSANATSMGNTFDINDPDPSNDFIDAVVPQTLRDPLINLPSFNQVNDSAINPQPFINFDPEKKTSNLPIIIGLLLLGFFIIK